MKQRTVHLGFEVPSGKPVEIPVAHLCVTGQTQLSGKTTTLEALIFRSDLKAIAFLTKRGESAFGPLATTLHDRNVLQPYFRHRADWQFVSDILGAILSEKLKFQRPWIMKICSGAKTLREVADRIPLYLHGDKKRKISAARGIAEGVYTELDEYFQLLLPEIERLPYTDKLELRPGLNVMDLSSYSTALQMLVIAATIDRINEKESGIVVVIPEAWEFCLSDDTEVLTKTGWIKGTSLSERQNIYCFHIENEHCRFEAVERIIIRDYEGPAEHQRGKWIDCLCTPEHRTVLKDFDHVTGQAMPDWSFAAAADVPSQFVVPSPRADRQRPGGVDVSDKFLRILGWVITDGWWFRKGKALGLEQSLATRKLGRDIALTMADVLAGEGASVRQRHREGKVQIDKNYPPCERSDSLIFIFGKGLSARVFSILGEDIHRIPRQLLEYCTEHQLRELFNGLMEGDGTTKRGIWSAFYAGLSEGLADDFQELCTLLGIRCVKSFIAKQWRVSLSPQRDNWIRKSPPTHYKGKVWDVTVPTGAFIARRNGKVFVTGNCPNQKNSPVKRAAISLARKGAGIQNFMWLDSQDLASIDTEVRRACSVWILGVQREQNEVKRTLSHITDAPKPKVDDIMQLERGQFFVCHGREVKKVYVQPAWMSEKMAKDISGGKEPATEFTIRRVKGKNLKEPAPSAMGLAVFKDDDAVREAFPGWGRIDRTTGEVIEPENYNPPPPTKIQPIIDDGGKNEVTNEEHDRKVHDLTTGYENQIKALERILYETQRRLPGELNYAKTHSFEEWRTNPDKRGWSSAETDPIATENSGNSNRVGSQESHQFMSEESLKLLAHRLTPYLPTNGRVTVEPREYHLKQFCQGEVNRIMAQVNDLSAWQRQVLVFLTAKGVLMQKSEILRALTGKSADQIGGTYKDKYSEIDQLTAMGYLENRGKRWGSQIRDTVKERLSAFEAADEDIEQTVATILANLK